MYMDKIIQLSKNIICLLYYNIQNFIFISTNYEKALIFAL